MEQKKLIEVLQGEEMLSPYRNILLIRLYNGMRIGEILTLDKTQDLNFVHQTLLALSELNHYFKRICKKHNISNNLNFHILRHAYSTRCIAAVLNAKVPQKN